jgi:hypothetical protein
VISNPELMEKIEDMSDNKDLRRHQKSCKKWMKKNGKQFRRRLSGFTLFSRSMFPGTGLTDDGKRNLVSFFNQRLYNKTYGLTD